MLKFPNTDKEKNYFNIPKRKKKVINKRMKTNWVTKNGCKKNSTKEISEE